MPQKSTDHELTESAPAREARRRIEWVESYVQGLELAVAMANRGNVHDDRIAVLRNEVNHARSYIRQLSAQAGAQIHSRKRPKKVDGSNRCLVFLDECGSSHSVVQPHDFQAFVLAAAIVRVEDVATVDARWNEWKRKVWQRDDVIIHEPEVRKRLRRWSFGGDAAIQQRVETEMNDLISSLPFKALAVVVRREAYIERCREAGLDESLPAHIYHMALDFLCERIVMTLDANFAGARGEIVAEARGAKDDALLQHEFVRLHLDGTSYIAPAWFRQQLAPAIQFEPKSANIPGLQLADLLARPCGERVLAAVADPGPPRWAEFRDKLVATQKTINSPLGIKIVPWDDRFSGIWEL